MCTVSTNGCTVTFVENVAPGSEECTDFSKAIQDSPCQDDGKDCEIAIGKELYEIKQQIGVDITALVASITGTVRCSSGGCFDKHATTVCLLASPDAACEHVLMADLVPGDLVLGRDGPTTVVANQHKKVDTRAAVLTISTADGASLSLTPDHGLFVDGTLVSAADAKVGARVVNAEGESTAIERITTGEAAVINAVTASGTIVADGIAAASNPFWIARHTVDSPTTRALVNAGLYLAGDVDTIAAGITGVLVKVMATLAVVVVVRRWQQPMSV